MRLGNSNLLKTLLRLAKKNHTEGTKEMTNGKKELNARTNKLDHTHKRIFN